MIITSSLTAHDNAVPAAWLNQIHQGDCLQLLAQLPDESVDLVVTSPPYNLRNSTGNGARAWAGYDGYTDDIPHEEYVAWQRQCLAEMLRVLKPTGAIFYQHCWRVQDGLFQGRADILEGFPLRQIIIWHRSGSQNHNPGYFVPDYEVIYLIAKPEFRLVDGCNDGAVWRINQDQSGDYPDLPVWPMELPRRAIAATDAKIVLDPFSGSGTTAVAALLEGRDYIGIEQSARYVAISRQRVAETTSGRDIPALPLTPSPADPPKPEQRRFRGSVQVVFDHVQSVLAANGWAPAVLHQANVASDLALSKITVVRAIQALKAAGAIVVHNHGRWSTYALGNGQPQPTVSSITADVTSAMSAHFEPTSSPENDVTSAKNDVTSAMSAHFEPTSSPENDVTSAKMMLHRRCRLILSPHPALKMMLHQPKMMLHRRCRLILSPHPALKMMLHQPKMMLHRRCRLILNPHPALKMMLHRRFWLKMTLHQPKMMLYLHPGPGPGTLTI